MKKQELKKTLEEKRENIVDLTLEAMKKSLTFHISSRRTDIAININTWGLSSHVLTSPSDELLGVVEGYMVVVTSVSMSDISDWASEYFDDTEDITFDEMVTTYLDQYTSDLEEAADKTVEQGIGDLLYYWQE